MSKISQALLIKAYRKKLKTLHLSTAKVAAHCELSRSYLYHVVSPRYKMNITEKIARKVGAALGLRGAALTRWIKSLIPKDQKLDKAQPVPTIKSKTSTNPRVLLVHQNLSRLMEKNRLAVDQVAAKSGLNTDRLKEMLKNKELVIPKLTLVRLARGFRMSPAGFLRKLNSKPQPKSKPRKQKVFRAPQKPSKSSYNSRPSVRRAVHDLEQLSDADLAIVDLFINRIAEAEHYRK